MKFEDLKGFVKAGHEMSTLLMHCPPSFMKKQFNLDVEQSCNLVCTLCINHQYYKNHKLVNETVCAGYVYYYPKLNTKLNLDTVAKITKQFSVIKEYGVASIVFFDDSDCEGLRVLNSCSGTECSDIKQ